MDHRKERRGWTDRDMELEIGHRLVTTMSSVDCKRAARACVRQDRTCAERQANESGSCTTAFWTCQSVPGLMVKVGLLSEKLPSARPSQSVVCPLPLRSNRSSMPSPLKSPMLT